MNVINKNFYCDLKFRCESEQKIKHLKKIDTVVKFLYEAEKCRCKIYLFDKPLKRYTTEQSWSLSCSVLYGGERMTFMQAIMNAQEEEQHAIN